MASLKAARARRALFSPALRAALDGHDPGARIARIMDATDDADPLRQAQMVDLETYLPGDILTKVDRTSMATGLEVRARRLLGSPVRGNGVWVLPAAR